MGEHQHESEHEEDSNSFATVATGLGYGDYAHLVADAVVEGGAHGETLTDIGEHMLNEGAHFWGGARPPSWSLFPKPAEAAAAGTETAAAAATATAAETARAAETISLGGTTAQTAATTATAAEAATTMATAAEASTMTAETARALETISIASEAGETASAASAGLTASTAVMAPLAVFGGIMEMMEAGHEWKEGHHEDAAISGMSGALTAGSGVAATLGTLGGSAIGAAAAPLLLAGATGLKFGHWGDKQLKKRGLLRDDDGNALSGSEWAANKGQAADEWVSKHLSGSLGTAAGIATSIAASIPAAGMVGENLLETAGQGLADVTHLSNLVHRAKIGDSVRSGMLEGAHAAKSVDAWRVE